MIKKVLRIVLLLINVGIVNSFAQVCTPDVSCVPVGKTYGICPDSATGMAIGTVGVPYTQTMSMMVPATGTDFGYPSATITSIDITSVDSLAPGLTYQCVPASCSFPGNSNHCILISGTPTMVWNKLVIVNATAHATISGFPASLPQSNKQYRSIVIPSTTSIETLDLNKFDVQQNAPNPFDGKSEIRFSSITNSDVEFKVYNMLGSIVFANKYKAEKGINMITIESNSFVPGLYVYSIKNGDKIITKRMVVSNK
jgi:hypothetical protein